MKSESPRSQPQILDLNPPLISQQKIDRRIWFKDAKCSYGNACAHVCAYEKCKSNGIVCAKSQCPCYATHQKEELCTLINPETVMKRLLKKRINNPIISNFVKLAFSEMIDWISQLEDRIEEKMQSVGWTEEDSAFFSSVEKEDFQLITGEKVGLIKQSINEKRDEIDFELLKSEVQSYWDKNKGRIHQDFEGILKIVGNPKAHFNKKFCTKVNNVLEPCESKIVENRDEIGKLVGFFDEKREIAHFQLLYRGSDSAFTCTEINKKCQGAINTLTLVRTEYKKVIGGYTPIAWVSDGGWKNEPKNESFLFSLTNNDKFTLKSGSTNTVIHSSSSHYLTVFGGGYDLYIADKANQNRNSSAHIGNTYLNSKYTCNQAESWQRFGGSNGSDSKFRVEELEVYKVVFADEL